jgi:EAL domain-containing protein (putative c-di-GMP-specific phosphodiesterase class I)
MTVAAPLRPASGRLRPSAALPADVITPRIAFQPIVDVTTGLVVAVEALARFDRYPFDGDGSHGDAGGVAVEQTFAAAYAAGRGHLLEAACVRAAFERRGELPSGVFLSVNVSPDALSHPAVQDALAGNLAGVIVEVTEHAASRPVQLVDDLRRLRRRGAVIAVDDASKGHSGLQRLAALRPDLVKLDGQLVTGARRSADRMATIQDIVQFTRRLDSSVLGEGVESPADLELLAELEVDYAQGNGIAAPRPSYEPPLAPVDLVAVAS